MSFEELLTTQKLAPATIKTHLRNLERFDKIGKNQELMLNQLETLPTLPIQQSVAGTFSKYLKYQNKANNKIVEYLKNSNDKLRIATAEKNKAMSEDTSLPNVSDLTKRMNDLYDKQDFRGFVVMYLMLTYQVRNMDMMAKVVRSMKETNDTDNWFVLGKTQVKWIRQKYKTSSVFGTKFHTIKNKKFVNAISNLEAVLTPSDNIDRTMKKITGGLTEGTVAKIMIRDNDSINGLKRISENRGTRVDELIASYNITLSDE